MATKRLISVLDCPCDGCEAKPCGHPAKCVKFALWLNKNVDAVPVDEIRLHHILIDNEGVPEIKIQIGDRYFVLRTDPVDVRKVVHGWWEWITEDIYGCTNCGATNHVKEVMGQPDFNYCPNCGAKMDGDGNG